MVVSYHLKPAAQDTGYLRRVWETVNPASCPHTYNFHLHTVASDGRLEPIDLINQAIAIGLKGLAITDHHSVAGFQEAQAYLSSLRSA
ncbi:MAG: PHP domain-containing protein, partial [Cyanobacteria bacterium J06588_4]